jgi:hypothetical protein
MSPNTTPIAPTASLPMPFGARGRRGRATRGVEATVVTQGGYRRVPASGG